MRQRLVWWTALPLALAPAAANAQVPLPPASATPETVDPAAAETGEFIEFSAGQVTYDSQADVVTASGAVRLERDGNHVAADEVTWNRNTGEVRAKGNVVVMNPQGDKFIGDNVVLADTLRDGTVDNLLIVLESGGRIAAKRGQRAGDLTTLENAIYSPCPITTEAGCPRNPSWSITAARVTYDPKAQRVRFSGRCRLLEGSVRTGSAG